LAAVFRAEGAFRSTTMLLPAFPVGRAFAACRPVAFADLADLAAASVFAGFAGFAPLAVEGFFEDVVGKGRSGSGTFGE
jgi:hypothetical protein